VKGYKFKVEFVVWGTRNQEEAKNNLTSFLLASSEDNNFNIEEPEFIGEVDDPAEKLREEMK